MSRCYKFINIISLATMSAAVILLLGAVADAHARSGKGSGSSKQEPNVRDHRTKPIVRDHRKPKIKFEFKGPFG